MINRVSKIVLLFLILGVLCLIIVGNIRGYDIEKNGKIVTLGFDTKKYEIAYL